MALPGMRPRVRRCGRAEHAERAAPVELPSANLGCAIAPPHTHTGGLLLGSPHVVWDGCGSHLLCLTGLSAPAMLHWPLCAGVVYYIDSGAETVTEYQTDSQV